jgi:hypothetical protein
VTRILATPAELEAIARRVQRQPVFSAYGDCSQAYADRRVLMDHLLALEAAGAHALGTLDLAPIDLEGYHRALTAQLAEDW